MSAVLADGWLSLPISEIADFGSGDSISVAQLSERSGVCPVPVFGGNGIAGYTSSATVSEPTVILGRVGQKCGVVYRNLGPVWITDNALYARRFKRPVDIQFTALALEAARLNDVKNHNDLPLITQSILRDVKIAWPKSLDEQRHIAETVSDADEMIIALERLIAKKQAIKQGMIQQLLTGRTRLLGFTEEWKPLPLRASGSTYGGLTGKSKPDFGIGQARYVTFLDVIYNTRISEPTLELVDVHPAEHQNRVINGDVLFNGSSETPEEVALSAVVDFEAEPATYLNSFCYGYRLREGSPIDPTYLAYFFRASPGRALISSLAQGATRYNIAKTKFLELAPLLPPLDEQAAVVRVLNDADDELAALRIRLVKARSIKAGMMQQLLTGRTRLTLPEAAA